MVLRSLARRVVVPALRRALGPRVSPPAGSGPLAARSSQAGYRSGPQVDAARMAQTQHHRLFSKAKDAQPPQGIVILSFLDSDLIRRSRRVQKINRRLHVLAQCIGGFLGLYVSSLFANEFIQLVEMRRAMEKAEMEEDEDEEEEEEEVDMELRRGMDTKE